MYRIPKFWIPDIPNLEFMSNLQSYFLVKNMSYFLYTCIFGSQYLANQTSNMLSGRIPDIEKGRISGTFLTSRWSLTCWGEVIPYMTPVISILWLWGSFWECCGTILFFTDPFLREKLNKSCFPYYFSPFYRKFSCSRIHLANIFTVYTSWFFPKILINFWPYQAHIQWTRLEKKWSFHF